MNRLLLSFAAAFSLFTGPAWSADWKPARGPLMTRWAKDVSPDKVHREYPRPQMVRKDWKNLNGLWQLAFARKGEAPPLGKDLPERILVPFPVESALSGVMKRVDRLWYRRTFTVPESWSKRRVLLHFGAVDWETTVWVNGKKLGEHRGGYDAFTFDITEALTKTGPQELVVGVWDPTDQGTQPRGKQVKRPEGIWYTPTTGIWQTVWLEPVAKTYIQSLSIVPDVDAGKVRVTIRTTGIDWRHTLYLKSEIDDHVHGLKPEKATSAVTMSLNVPKAKLWSPNSPTLYNLEVYLNAGVDPVDSVQSYFGMRKVSIGKDDKGVIRILLNNKFVFQIGPLDQGFWPDGLYTAPTDEALKYDIEVTKKLGFNMTRKHVKVEPARWYYWCDKLGLLVWQDMPSGDRYISGNQLDIQRSPDSAKQYEHELTRMIDGLRNHPSVIMWVVFNEGWGQFDTARIVEFTKKLDPTRLVDSASGWTDRKVGDVHDIHSYPAPNSPQPEEKRAAVLGEFGGLGLGIDGHAWSGKAWSYLGTRDRADLTQKYERLIARAWHLKNKPGLSAAVYTQITDVETEGNGLLTYDREVIKVDVDRVRAVNRGDLSRVPRVRTVVLTAREKPIVWRYTFAKPAPDWFKPDFDDSAWKRGPAGFGTEGTPGAKVRTVWKTDDIWIRREFTLPRGNYKDLHLLVHHDEDAEIYVNGILAARVSGYVTDYQELEMTARARTSIKPGGKNHLAVHCHQTTGGQYIDVGLVEIK
jgi:hypothetical protein